MHEHARLVDCIRQDSPLLSENVADTPDSPVTVADAIAARVRALRADPARDWSAGELADRLTAAGLPTKRSSVAALENRRRADITIGELFAFARVFNVPLIELFGDPLDLVPVTPDGTAITVAELLDWIAGAWLPNALDPDSTLQAGYERAAEPWAAHREHSALLDNVLGLFVTLPDALDAEPFRSAVDELARHRLRMRWHGERDDARNDGLRDRPSAWYPPPIPYDEQGITAAVEEAEGRVWRAYPRTSSTPAQTPQETS